jgi:hypothetical protein
VRSVANFALGSFGEEENMSLIAATCAYLDDPQRVEDA